MVRQACAQAGIPPAVYYTMVAVWTYAGSPEDLQPQSGVLSFEARKAALPNTRVFVSNFFTEVAYESASSLGWRRNIQWQSQASTQRHRLTEAARSMQVIAPERWISTILIVPFVDMPEAEERDREVDTAPFWSDPEFWQVRPGLLGQVAALRRHQ